MDRNGEKKDMDAEAAAWILHVRSRFMGDRESRLSRRGRILALYRQQGRPQAHLDRVMRLGRA